MRHLFSVMAISFLLVLTALAQSPPPQAANYRLVWSDTFSALSLCTTDVAGCNWYNPGVWWLPAGGIITDPSDTYVNLQWYSGQANANSTNIATTSWTGTHYRAWTYGYFEFSAAFDVVTGSFPAIYMVPEPEVGANTASDGVYYGELDVMEWQSQTPTKYYGTIHVWKNQSDVANTNCCDTFSLPTGADLSTYNTYGVLWTPTSISWYFNNLLMGTMDTTASPYSLTFGGQQPYFIIMSQQAGCNWTTPCPGQVNPTNMRVQWVHVYAPVPAPPTQLTVKVQ